MAALRGAFFDTSVLIAGVIALPGAPDSAQRVMAAVARGEVPSPQTAWHCCLEFYSVTTRLPPELRLSPAQAWLLLQEEILGRFEVLQLPEAARRTFLAEAAGAEVRGGRVYDAHIAEIARQAAREVVVTDNPRHFVTLLASGVRVLTSAQFAAEL